MHLFKGSGESCVTYKPHEGTVLPPHRAEPALRDAGGLLDRQALAGTTQETLAVPAVEGAPPWGFP